MEASRAESRVGGRSTGADTARYAARLAVLAAVYYVAAKLGLKLSLVHRNITPLWPPTGIAVAALLVFGRRLWPGVAIGAFLVNLPISTNAGAALATAAGNTIAPLLAVTLLHLVGFRRRIDRWRDALAIVFLAALFAMTISATIGTLTLVVSGALPSAKFASAWAVWWTGDAMGVLAVTPFLLVSDEIVRWRPRARDWLEWLVTLAVIGGVTLGVTNTSVRMLSVVIPLLVWAAWRFEQRGAAPAALIAVAIASWAAAHDWPAFRMESLFARMASLQVFNAAVAFSSLVFAALVSERNRSREGLQQAAAELEQRVESRTAEVLNSNRRLAEAQQLARIGSWEWHIPTGQVAWSDEMFRIYGYEPGAFEVTFDRAMERVAPEDADRIRANVAVDLESDRDRELPESDYSIVLPDGERRVLHSRSSLQVGSEGRPIRIIGTVQDVTEARRAEREHRIAETLQRSMLPERLPRIPGVLLAARYVPASEDMEVGGDWYDVVPLPNGQIGLAVGDVAGHGLRAATIMGQLRMALRAYALEDTSPARVLGRLHHLSQRLEEPEMATLVYCVYDPEKAELRYASAGHLPPLVVDANGRAEYLEGDVEPPLGTVSYPDTTTEHRVDLPIGSTLLLFTDGLVERRGASIKDGLGALRDQVAVDGHDLEGLCDRLVRVMVGDAVSDDLALLALRALALGPGAVRLEVPAEPQVLAHLRQTLRRWLRELGADPADVNELLIASGEAWANAIQHAYGAGQGSIEVELRPAGAAVEIVTRDRGSWRPASVGEGGRGIELMRGFTDSVDVDTSDEGTVVTLRKRLHTA